MTRASTPALLLLACVLPACTRDRGDQEVDDTLSVDGVLVIRELGDHLLLDPATGRLGPSIGGRFLVAPDLASVLHMGPGGLLRSIVGRAADGTPTLTSTLVLAQPLGGSMTFDVNVQGDRLSGLGGWWDLETGEHLTVDNVAASPDGRHHVESSGLGDGALLLYDDQEPVMLVGQRSFTSDGDWIVASGLNFSLTHVPTRTQLPASWIPVDPLSGFPIPYSGSDASGRLLFLPAGRRGLTMPAQCGLPADVRGPIAPITQHTPARLADGQRTPRETPLDALNALPWESGADGVPFDGFEWTVLAVTPDATAAIVQHRWYDLVQATSGNPGCAIYSYVPRTLDLFRVELGGTGALQHQVSLREADGPEVIEAIAQGCTEWPAEAPPDRAERVAPRHQRAVGVQFLSETDWVCGALDLPIAAFVEGEGRALPTPGVWATLERTSLLGPAPAAGAAEVYRGDTRVTTGLCQGPLAGGVSGCILPPDLWWSRTVVAQVGVNAVPRASTGPVVTALSHAAATPGTVVRVLGYGFGEAGTLMVGDTEIEAIEDWSDTNITFVMPAGAPDMGRVVVQGDDGAESAQRHLWLGKSEAWSGRPVVPHESVELRQGVNRITFPGAGQYTVGIRSLSQILPGGDLPNVPLAVGPDYVDAVVEHTTDERVEYPWITFRGPKGTVFRPLTFRSGLVDGTRWQPIPGQSNFAYESRFVASEGALNLWQRGAVGVSVSAAAPDVDWGITTVMGLGAQGPIGLLYHDNEHIWRASGSTFDRVTAWVPGDGVQTPVFTPEITSLFAAPITAYAVWEDLVVVALQETQNGRSYGSLHVSTDHGGEFAELIAPDISLWTTWGAVVAGSRPGLYGSVSQANDTGGIVGSLARVTPAGALELRPTIPRTPTGETRCHDGYVAYAQWLLCHDAVARALYAVDVGDEGAGWEEVGGAHAGQIASLFLTDSGALLVGTDLGGIWRTTDLVHWTLSDQLTYGPAELPLQVLAFGELPGGGSVAVAKHTSWGNPVFLVRAEPTP